MQFLRGTPLVFGPTGSHISTPPTTAHVYNVDGGGDGDGGSGGGDGGDGGPCLHCAVVPAVMPFQNRNQNKMLVSIKYGNQQSASAAGR